MPECFSLIVVGIEEDVAFLDAEQAQLTETPFDEGSPNALLTMRWDDGKVVEVSTTTIVATQDGPHDLPILAGNKTEVWVSGQIGGDSFPGVGMAIQANTFGGLPQGHDLVVVLNRHQTNVYVCAGHKRRSPMR
jgi:hypothetical protein